MYLRAFIFSKKSRYFFYQACWPFDKMIADPTSPQTNFEFCEANLNCVYTPFLRHQCKCNEWVLGKFNFLREISNFFCPIHQRLCPHFCAYFSNGQNGQALIQFEFCIWIELHWDWRSNVLGKRGIVIRMMSLLPGDMALIKPSEPKK